MSWLTSLSVDYPQEENEERSKKEELLVPCNSAPHLFPLLEGGGISKLMFGICWVCWCIVMVIYMHL